jgi:hypothetical protein
MVDEDFVQKMREVIAAQKSRAEAERDAKLHSAQVIDEEGQRTWDSLRSATRAYTNKIGTLDYVPASDREFTLHYENNVLRVGFEEQRAIITYDGLNQSGSFRPKVSGDELAYYSASPSAADNGNEPALEEAATPLTVHKMAEQLIAILIG